jgi:hypothetical protein
MKKLIAIVIFLILAGCGTENAEFEPILKIYQSYKVEYIQNTDMTKVYASFREKNPYGDKIVIEEPMSFTMNSQSMNLDTSRDYPYYSELQGRVSPIVFHFENPEMEQSTIVEASLDSVRSIGLPKKADTINLDTTFHAKWDGESVGKKERITVNIFDSEDKSLGLFSEFINDDSLTFYAAELTGLKSGPGKIEIRRRLEVDINDLTPYGGVLHLINTTGRRDIYLKKAD